MTEKRGGREVKRLEAMFISSKKKNKKERRTKKGEKGSHSNYIHIAGCIFYNTLIETTSNIKEKIKVSLSFSLAIFPKIFFLVDFLTKPLISAISPDKEAKLIQEERKKLEDFLSHFESRKISILPSHEVNKILNNNGENLLFKNRFDALLKSIEFERNRLSKVLYKSSTAKMSLNCGEERKPHLFEIETSPSFESETSPSFESETSPSFESETSPSFESETSPSFESETSPSNCTICLSEKAVWIFLPCTHPISCEGCFPEIRKNKVDTKCPICRTETSEVVYGV